jgi:hypothetical protein
MKKSILILCIILVGSVKVVYGDFPRHVDPNILLEDDPGYTALFSKYSEIYGLIASGEYDVAIEQIKVIEGIPATTNVRRVISEYSDLLSNVITELRETHMGISQGYNYLEYLMDLEAEISLRNSLSHLLNANQIQQELDSDSVSFANLLKGSPDVLLEGNADLDKRIEYLISIVDQGLAQVKEIQDKRMQGLIDSKIELSVHNNNPLLGSSVRIIGRLVSANFGLTDKNIELYIQGGFLGSVDTDENGEFSYEFEVPYIYRNQHVIRAEYFPIDKDVLKYTPSYTETTFSPIYYTPVIHAQIPDTVYPGQEFEIKGEVEYPGETQLTINLEAFGLSTTRKSNNEFMFRLLIPKGQNQGKYLVKLSTNSNELIGPALLIKEINVEYHSSSLTSQRSFFVLLAGSLEVQGSLASQGSPVSKSSIECSMGKQRLKTVTNSNGEFAVNINLNPLSFSSRRTLIITAVPTQPWIKGDQIIKTVTVINILTLIPLLLIILVYMNVQRVRDNLTFGEPPIGGSLESVPKYQILSGFSLVYQGALNIIQNRTEVKISSSETLREYSEAMKSKLPKPIFRLFKQVTSYYERWVYGPNKRRPPIKISTQIVAKMSDLDE